MDPWFASPRASWIRRSTEVAHSAANAGSESGVLVRKSRLPGVPPVAWATFLLLSEQRQHVVVGPGKRGKRERYFILQSYPPMLSGTNSLLQDPSWCPGVCYVDLVGDNSNKRGPWVTTNTTDVQDNEEG